MQFWQAAVLFSLLLFSAEQGTVQGVSPAGPGYVWGEPPW